MITKHRLRNGEPMAVSTGSTAAIIADDEQSAYFAVIFQIQFFKVCMMLLKKATGLVAAHTEREVTPDGCTAGAHHYLSKSEHAT
jgi:hypothetical protein